MSKNSFAPVVRFHYAVPLYHFNNRTVLKDFLIDLFKKEGKALRSLDYIFCSDEYLLEINKQFLKHEDFTDVITFDLSDDKYVEGEIYISIDRVRDNARTLGLSTTEELHRVIFHGSLHLCGFKDKTPKNKQEMRSKEDFWLHKYFKQD